MENRLSLENCGDPLALFGHHDENLRLAEKLGGVRIVSRGDEVIISGENHKVEKTRAVFLQMMDLQRRGHFISPEDFRYAFAMAEQGMEKELADALSQVIITTTRGKPVKPKTLGQEIYVRAMETNDITFGIGPAGTGKTYLAVVMAVRALKNRQVGRIVLTRPAVEAGEKLGFLPGDLQEKVDPYLRPLYDGLFDVLGAETTQKHLEKGIVEVAPLAYMRGRTLDDSFIILDEAQNTTPEQMKMFLTRLGFGSKAVITGDVTQIDLPQGRSSGLMTVQKILQGIEGISFQFLTADDVVRNPMVKRIIEAYESFEGELR